MTTKQSLKNIFENSIIKNLLLIILAGILLIFLTLFLLSVYTRHGQNVIVPKLHGLQVPEAKTILKSKGLHAEVVDSIYKRGAIPGAIIDQTPKPDNKVKEGRAIYVTIYAKSPQKVAIPALVDYSSRQAIALLNSLGFTDLAIEEVPAQYSGLVMAVEYKGKILIPNEEVPSGSALKLVVGSGMLTDSLNVDREYIVIPGESRTNDSTRANKPKEQKNKIDESFF